MSTSRCASCARDQVLAAWPAGSRTNGFSLPDRGACRILYTLACRSPHPTLTAEWPRLSFRSYTVDAAIADAKQCITTDPRSLLSDGTREAILTLIGKDFQQTAAAAEQDLQGFSDDGAPPAKQQKTEREFKRKQSSFVVEPPTIDGKMTQQNGELRRALEKIKPALAHVLECEAGYIAMPRSKMPLGAVRCTTCVDQIRDLQRAFHNAGWTNGSGRAVDISEIPSPVSKLISGMRTQRSVAEYK